MKAKEYQFTINSRGGQAIMLLIPTILGSAACMLFGKEMSEPARIFVIAGIIFVSYFLSLWGASAKVTVRMSEKGFEHIWNRRFFLCFKKDRFIPWNQIEGMKLRTAGRPARFETPASWYYFTLKVKDDKDYSISKSFMGVYDTDFTEFIRNFMSVANEFKKEEYPDLDPIAEL